MNQNPTKKHPKVAQTYNDERDDVSLIRAISQQKEQRALAVLFERYRKPAYNLAYRMTQQRETALDILQETMLTVWQTAGNYRETGLARSWLLRIVALKSMRALRDQGRKRRGLEIKKTLLVQQMTHSSRDPLEHDDVLASLRGALNRLTTSDQELLALRFGGGLNWVQMGQTLGLPARTLRYRVNQCLEKLRTNMHKAGAPACAMLIKANQLHEAICSGIPFPQKLNGWIKDCAAEIAQEPLTNKHFLSFLKFSMTRLILFAGLSTAVVTGFIVRSTKSNVTQQSVTNIEEQIPSSQTQDPRSVSRNWSFEKPPQGLQILQGSWDWIAPKNDKPGVMAIGPESFVLQPQLRIPKGPFLVELTIRPNLLNNKEFVDKWSFIFGAMWESSRNQRSKSWRNRKPFGIGRIKMTSQEKNNQVFVASTYFFDHYEITVVKGGTIFNVIDYEQPIQDEWAILLLKNVLLERIEMRTITFEQLPKAIQNPSALIKKLTASGKLSPQRTEFIPADKK